MIDIFGRFVTVQLSGVKLASVKNMRNRFKWRIDKNPYEPG